MAKRKKKRKSYAEALGLTPEQYRALAPRDRYLRLAYGLTEAQYRAMEGMNNGCWICGREPKPGRRLSVDHDHKGYKRVRGLLCYRCNHRLLGRGLEDASLHSSAARYLRDFFDGRNVKVGGDAG